MRMLLPKEAVTLPSPSQRCLRGTPNQSASSKKKAKLFPSSSSFNLKVILYSPV